MRHRALPKKGTPQIAMRASAFCSLVLASCDAYVLTGIRQLPVRERIAASPIASEEASEDKSAIDKIVGDISDIFSKDDMGGGNSAKDLASMFFKVPEARASHILFSLEEHGDDGGSVMAASCKELISNGQLTFEQAAEKLSACSSSQKGGDLGSFKRGAMVPEFEAAVFDKEMPLGELLGPIKTKFGYHLIKVVERTG